MSYRAFKRLLGETSLERKCRFLFGAFILLLLFASFWFYAHQTKDLAYEQLKVESRLLANQTVDRSIATDCRPPGTSPIKSRDEENPEIKAAHKEWENIGPSAALKNYRYDIIRPDAENVPHDNIDLQYLKTFQSNPNLPEITPPPSERVNDYYAPVRATKSCIECHSKVRAGLQENDLIAVVKISVPTDEIERGVHVNNAILISTALVTALLIMGGSYLIVRYVIVKPVKHLKEVSDAISAGELNIRSEIQTGDEFEDLSHAFNRMLRNLVNMQDRLKKVNADLDRKVDELARANMALYESNRLKSDFLATVSHELRTPLNSILGFSEVLESNTGLSDKETRWVRNIHSSGTQLLNLINDILDLAKIEAGKMQVRLVEFSSYDVCEGMLTMFRPLAEKKNIDLRSSLAPGIPLLRQDVVKFQQILSNLLSNAIKFTPEGGRVLLKAETDLSNLLLTVSDTGVGIAPEEQGLVFEKFRQSGNPLTREHAGTGLGLSIVRELSKLLGGEVTLHSELGRGSTFVVRLPLQLSEEPQLEFDLAHHGIDLSKAQRVDARLFAGAEAPATQ
jgi:signal transduction histidine kinase